MDRLASEQYAALVALGSRWNIDNPGKPWPYYSHRA
jgi:hypothetical protein